MTTNHSDNNTAAHSTTTTLSYRDAGVDIDAGNRLVEAIKPFARKTFRPEVLTGIGNFGALFEISQKYQNPVLVSGTDGVGTKLKLAFELDKHDSIGIDLVAMSVNDIIISGAEPLFFLDYFACGKLHVDTAATVVSGIAKGCEQAGCALIGGETAEMPDMYPAGEYDLAGFAVGIVEKNRIIDGSTIQASDTVIGLASNGAHANGYSLIRKIINTNHIDLSQDFHGKPLHEAIMAPTRIYAKPLQSLIAQLPVKGVAHITGGGLLENLPRILPEQTAAELHKATWDNQPLFHWLQQQGRINDDEMFRVFNCGIGMTVIVAADQTDNALSCLHENGEKAYKIGTIKQRIPGSPAVELI